MDLLCLDCYGELVVTGNVGPRWKGWYNSVVVFLHSDQGQDPDLLDHVSDQLTHISFRPPLPNL